MWNIFSLSMVLLGGCLITADEACLMTNNAEGLAARSPTFINPTGTYLLKGKVNKSRIVGSFGELRVHLLDSGTIALTFYLNKGYPGYESGALLDTLHYKENFAIYRPMNDSTCAIHFSFEYWSVSVSEELSDPHSGCGFRPGVMVAAVFDKTSSDIPVIQDLSSHGSR